MSTTTTTITYGQLAKLDYIYKRETAKKVKTDGLLNQTAVSSENEKFPVVDIVRADRLWGDSDKLLNGPAGAPVATLTKIQFTDIHNRAGIDVVSDLRGRAWNSAYINWVSPQFHANFALMLYHAASGTSPSSITATIDSTQYPWSFDYGSGILTFLGDVPTYLSNGSEVVFISGYQYTGLIGVSAVSGGFNASNIYADSLSVSSISGSNSSSINFNSTSLSNIGTINIQGITANNPNNTINMNNVTLSNIGVVDTQAITNTSGGSISFSDKSLTDIVDLYVSGKEYVNSIAPYSGSTISFNNADIIDINNLTVQSLNVAGEVNITNVSTTVAEQMVIQNDGVGAALLVNQTGVLSSQNVLELRSASNLVAFTNFAGQTAFGNYGITAPSPLPKNALVYIENPAASNQAALYVKQDANNDVLVLDGPSAPLVKVTSAGFIGMGTTTASARIHCVSDGTTPFIMFDNNSSSAFRVNADGRVGILTAPDATYALNVNGTMYATSLISSNISSDSGIINFRANEASNITNIYANKLRATTRGTETAPAITFNADDNTGVFSPAADMLAFTTGGAERLRIYSNGKVGINTNMPNVQLEINSTDAVRIPVGTTSQRPTGANGYIRYNSEIQSFEGYGPGGQWGSLGGVSDPVTSTSITAQLTPNTHDSILRFYINGAEQMRIDANSNVGIHTTTPTYDLTVAGTTSTTTLLTNTLSTLSANSAIDVSSKTLSNVASVMATNVEVTNIKPTIANGTINMSHATLSNITSVATNQITSSTGTIDLAQNAMSNVAKVMTDKVTTPSIESPAVDKTLTFNWSKVVDVDSLVVRSNITILQSGTTTITNLPTDVVRLDAGTQKIADTVISSNVVRLDESTGQINSALIPALYTANRASFLRTNDKVGIGLRNPQQQLHVHGNSVVTGGYIGVGVTNPVSSLHIYDNNASVGAQAVRIESAGSVDIMGVYGSNGFPVMFMNSSCNIGVGKVNPTYRLDVNGTGAFSVVRAPVIQSPAGLIDMTYNTLSNVFDIRAAQAHIDELWVTNDIHIPSTVTAAVANMTQATIPSLSTTNVTSSSAHVSMDVALNITGYDQSLVSGAIAGGTKIGLNVSEYIASKAALSTSDRRAKTAIKESSVADDVSAVLNIPVKRFAFIDKDGQSAETVGFIAQDVETAAPFAVHNIRAAIPNVMSYASLVSDKMLGGVPATVRQNVATGDLLKILVDEVETTAEVEVVTQDSIVFKTALPAGKTYYVYGKIVDDFKVLNSERLLPLVFNAVKDLHAKVTSQQQQLDAIVARLEKLESK